jgi:predicted acetyltransferase
MELSLPSVKYKDSFLDALREFHTEGRSFDLLDNLNIESLTNNFDDYVNKLIEQSRGERLPAGWIPHTTYWIIDNNEYIGTIDLRHGLTPALEKYGGHVGYAIRPSERKEGYATKALKMLLSIAFKMGIKKVLITCDANNIASIKIIESNGGILQDEIQNEGRKVPTRRYWLETRS